MACVPERMYLRTKEPSNEGDARVVVAGGWCDRNACCCCSSKPSAARRRRRKRRAEESSVSDVHQLRTHRLALTQEVVTTYVCTLVRAFTSGASANIAAWRRHKFQILQNAAGHAQHTRQKIIYLICVPVIETGPVAWEATILPLDHTRF